MPEDYTEDNLVEQPALQLLGDLGWETANCFHEVFGEGGTLGRETPAEVVLTSRLRPKLEELNPDVVPEAIDQAIEELTRDRSMMSLVAANREVYGLLKNGVKVEVRDEEGSLVTETIRLIDWRDPEKNGYFLASQLWVSGEMYKRRTDLVGFVNGIPLLFIELKASHRNVKHAYEHNFRDYKSTIPQLFWYTSRIILSNGSKSRIGSVTSGWEHFSEWKKIDSEGEEGVISLDTMLRGVCEPERLLDLVENFTLFMDVQGGTIKIVAKNHQYLGVNNALDSLQEIKENQGRLGVFWHTQGSGKSISMVFFAQKVLRKIPGNWTFLVVTDRTELDDQIYKNFANSGAISAEEKAVRAQDGEDLKEKLRGNNRYIFTLIQKFRSERGEAYPKLSDRSDIIVITDEAHRSQYDTLAMNMRIALPNAAFLAFTGTPLIAGEEKTREVFGEYVSIYNFRQSVEDGATVPLYYENRIPELEIVNERFNEEIEQVLEDAELDEAQERRLEQEFAREYHLITRDDRLEKIAEDLVAHFVGRGFRAKAMMISIDKATAVKMYDKVQKYWGAYIDRLKRSLPGAEGEERERFEDLVAYMEETDMAVIVSQSQNEVEDLHKKGADITPHRKRINTEDLSKKFKDSDDPLRLVFVCAMWITGFDAPACSTIYLDKPMKNHTLMQTIARANRVYEGKVNGLIVDYIGIFRNLQKALAIYGSASGGGVEEGDTPVQSKDELVAALKDAIEETRAFCTGLGVDLDGLRAVDGFEFIKKRDEAVEAILENDDTKREFFTLSGQVNRLFKAILPDTQANVFGPDRAIIVHLADAIRSLTPPADVSEVMEQVESVLDRSVGVGGYTIPAPVKRNGLEGLVDLSQIDFEALKKQFAQGKKRTEAERLKGLLKRKVTSMAQLNKSRLDYYKKLQEMIEDYNAGKTSIDLFFEQLLAFTRELEEEDKRGLKEGLTEEELAIYDILMKPAPEMTAEVRDEVKEVSREVLDKLKREKLVLDWRKRQRTRAAVRLCVEEILDRLPPVYDDSLYFRKCDTAYQHIYDSYFGSGKSVYSMAA